MCSQHTPSPSSPRLVALYRRVSTDEQAAHGYSLDDQRARATAWVASQHTAARPATLAGDYCDEGQSGAARHRPALRRLLDDAQAGRVTVVVFTKLDRLARRLTLLLELWDQLEAAGCAIVVLDESIDTSTPVGRLVRNVLGSIAEFERELIAGRMRAGRLAKARRGHTWKAQCPFGYRYLPKVDGVREVGELLIDEAEAGVVRRIFGWASTGMAQHAICAELDRAGIRPRRGAATWRQNTISDLLRNRTYMGESIYNQRESVVPTKPAKAVEDRRREKSARRYRPEEEWIRTPAPAIVSPDLWEAVAARRAAGVASSARNSKRSYMLGRGLLRCGVCAGGPTGQPLTMVGHTRRDKYRYECSDGWRTGRVAGETPCAHYVNGPLIEDRVWAAVLDLVRAPEVLGLEPPVGVDGAGGMGLPGASGGESADAQATRSRLAAARRRHELLASNLGLAETPAQIAAMLGQIERASAELTAAEGQAADADRRRAEDTARRATITAARDTLRALATTAEGAAREERAALLRLLVERIMVYPDRAEITGVVPELSGSVQLQLTAADEPVARREVARLRGGAHGVLGEERAVPRDLGGQGAVRVRIDDVDAAGEHGQRAPARLQRRAVGQTRPRRARGRSRSSRCA